MRTVLAIAVWFVLFTVGLCVKADAGGPGPLGLLVWLAASTVTNLGLLSVVASYVGNRSDTLFEPARRGFVLYLALISGTVVVFTEPLLHPTQEQYGKLAAAFSLACVLVNYNTTLFDGLIERISSTVTRTSQESTDEN